jgi:hypothetical protein
MRCICAFAINRVARRQIPNALAMNAENFIEDQPGSEVPQVKRAAHILRERHMKNLHLPCPVPFSTNEKGVQL